MGAPTQWAEPDDTHVLICDIDHFKSVNHGHGHATGDLVLTEVARHLAAQGIAGRLGGDEFAVWVPGTPREGDDAARAILQAVANAFAGEEIGPEVGISIGTASPGDDTDSLSLVLSRADEALYEAKRAGRARVVRYWRRRSSRRSASVNSRGTAGSSPCSHSVTTTSSSRGRSSMHT